MTRAEVIKGLELIIAGQRAPATWDSILRAAIALLRVPEVAEVEAARQWFLTEYVTVTDGGRRDRATLLRALDALAREPGLEARAQNAEAKAAEEFAVAQRGFDRIAELERQLCDTDPCGWRDAARMAALKYDEARVSVAALEAKLARVREWANAILAMSDEAAYESIDPHMAAREVLAALADEAAPEVKP